MASGRRSRLRVLARSRSGTIGLVIVALYGAKALLGSDELGRDLLSRIIHGSRISMTIGITAVALGAAVGTPLGLLSGYYGGRFDRTLMRLTDVLLSLPRILLAVTIAAIYGLG